jgi:hypothetical protein
MRTVILHYHLFKNAGTSLDRILKNSFPKHWVTKEFSQSGGDNSAEQRDWILENPDAVAFSTHTGAGPVPVIDGVKIISIMLLRDPIARIESAYRFERQQNSDSFGAQLAKSLDFEEYVMSRLNIPGDMQCRNFQTDRLASLVTGSEPALERAKEGLNRLTVVGRVEHFSVMMDRLIQILRPTFPNFVGGVVKSNTSAKESAKAPIDPKFEAHLRDVNADDFACLKAYHASYGPA